MAASFGTFGRIWSATARQWVLEASGVYCANAVAMKAETTRLLLLPAWATFIGVGDGELYRRADHRNLALIGRGY